MTRQQLNVRIPALTRRELDWLTEQFGMSEGEIVMLAIDQLYYRNEKVRPFGIENGKELVELIKSGEAKLPHHDSE